MVNDRIILLSKPQTRIHAGCTESPLKLSFSFDFCYISFLILLLPTNKIQWKLIENDYCKRDSLYSLRPQNGFILLKIQRHSSASVELQIIQK